MKMRRNAATATLLAALAAGGVLTATAGTALAQGPADRTPGPVPGMERMHELMTEQNPGMLQMQDLMTEQNPGMVRMHDLMVDGPR